MTPFIEKPDLSDNKIAIDFYSKEILHAGNKGKSFIVMNFNKIIGDYFNLHLSKSDTLNY
jgi:hypothetical protein